MNSDTGTVSHSTASSLTQIRFSTIKEILGSRDLIRNLVHRELTGRYKRSIIGFMWTMLNPIIMTFVYMVVFATIFNISNKDYVIYFLSAYLVWNFFAQSTSTAAKCILGAGGLIKKIYMPKIILVLSVVISALVNFVAALAPLFILVPILGQGFNISMLFLVVPFTFVFLFTLGVSLILASYTVFFVDIGEFYNVILMPWMFLTPIMYPIDSIAKKYLFLIKWNPMYYLIECFRMPIYKGHLPDTSMIAISGLISVVTLVIGYVVFTRNEDDFVYYV